MQRQTAKVSENAKAKATTTVKATAKAKAKAEAEVMIRVRMRRLSSLIRILTINTINNICITNTTISLPTFLRVALAMANRNEHLRS